VVERARPLRVQVGIIQWNEFFGHSQGIFTAGASYDFWKGPNDGAFAIYVDQAGYFQDHSPYRWAGAGIEYRQPLSMEGDFKPYVGAGIGAYRIDIHDDLITQNTRLGGKVFLGFDMRNGFFVEAGYVILGKVQTALFHRSRDLSRPSLSIGYRF
jgi:hypothetical protein